MPLPVYVPPLKFADACGLQSDSRCHLAVGWVKPRDRLESVLNLRSCIDEKVVIVEPEIAQNAARLVRIG